MDDNELYEIILDAKDDVDNIEVTDLSKDINEILDSVKEAIKLIIQNLSNSLRKIEVDKSSINQLLRDFSNDVSMVLKEADYHINRLTSNETMIKAWEKIKETYNFIAERIVSLVKDWFKILMGNERFKDNYDAFENKSQQLKKSFDEKYHEFTHDPNVRRVVVNATNTASRLSQDVVSKIKDYLK